mmetsp:Transcript_12100/g.25553  ORF Transcript_12100/g.25553 Transcript_12100/m.25553 type:complete len:313 (-) Transcript_12100:110-1048(-)
MFILYVLQQSLQLRPLRPTERIVIANLFILHVNHRRSPMHIVQVDRTHNISQIENILPRHFLRPSLDIIVIVPPPLGRMGIFVVEHGLHEVTIEEMRPLPPRLRRTQQLIPLGQTILEKVIDDFVVDPPSRLQGLHARTLDRVGIERGEDVVGGSDGVESLLDQVLFFGGERSQEFGGGEFGFLFFLSELIFGDGGFVSEGGSALGFEGGDSSVEFGDVGGGAVGAIGDGRARCDGDGAVENANEFFEAQFLLKYFLIGREGEFGGGVLLLFSVLLFGGGRFDGRGGSGGSFVGWGALAFERFGGRGMEFLS